jgi:hypothetical protein
MLVYKHIHMLAFSQASYMLNQYHPRYPDITPNWRPAPRYMHYQALYRGIFEYLREPPSHAHHSDALLYLQRLQACHHPSNVLQTHRIRWVMAWLDALGEPDSDADTVVGEQEEEVI